MARFSDMLVTYFVIGAVMWATGMTDWSDSGLAAWMVTRDGGVSAEISGGLQGMDGPIRSMINTVGGALLAIWGFMEEFIGFVAWPVAVLHNANAPIEIVVLLGGTVTAAFVGAVIRTVRGSA